MPDTLLGPVGRCIYCRVETYAPNSTQRLGDEHIIAEALNGKLVLQEASCRKCEQNINRWETALFRGVMLGCRTHLELKTSSKRPEKLPLFDPREENKKKGKERKVDISIEDYPISLQLVVFQTPRLFDPSPCFIRDADWVYWFRPVDWDILLRKYDLQKFATSSLDTFALCRTLAKTAHAFTVANLGLEGFIPALPHFIMGDYDQLCLYYVGGKRDFDKPSSELHEFQ